MPKVSIKTLDNAATVPVPRGATGPAQAKAYFADDKAPLHLHLYEIASEAALGLTDTAIDRVVFVWRGEVEVGGHGLAAGSSVIIEHGRSLQITNAGRQAASLLVFAAAHPAAAPRMGGNVHVLPVERVPRAGPPAGTTGVGGGLHADSACPTCAVWLHENHMPGSPPPASRTEQRGVHSHTEDEVIFVTAGQIRLGMKLYGPGTALAIARDTLYSFTPGPDGVSFINFRAGMPGDIQFADGTSMSETGYWRGLVARPDYLEAH
jgi:hypothetical protein